MQLQNGKLTHNIEACKLNVFLSTYGYTKTVNISFFKLNFAAIFQFDSKIDCRVEHVVCLLDIQADSREHYVLSFLTISSEKQKCKICKSLLLVLMLFRIIFGRLNRSVNVKELV